MKKFKNDDYCSYGVLLILIPFILSVVLTAVFVPIDENLGNQSFILFTPEGYTNMTEQERIDFLHNYYGGEPYQEYRWELGWDFPFFAGYVYYVFPSGMEMNSHEYEKYVTGQFTGDADYVKIALQMLTIDPPALKILGVFGLLIRLILIVCIAIGLVDILWIG